MEISISKNAFRNMDKLSLSSFDIERIIDSYSEGFEYLQEQNGGEPMCHNVYSREDNATVFVNIDGNRVVVKKVRHGNRIADE